jgi:transmembrane sensor
MDQIDKRLLNLYFSGNCLPHEEKQVEDWINKNEKNKELFYEALEKWESENLKTTFNPTVEFNKILAAEYEDNFGASKKRITTPFNLKVAASIIILLSFSILFFKLIQNKEIVYTAAYGETKTIRLPDHSVVTLNSNSSLRVSNDWDEKKTREVVLKGEAFFSIVHTVSNQKFIVKASDGVIIEVLGTEFNVNTRRQKTVVVLNKGKIRMSIREGRKPVQFTMKPGELVEVKSQQSKITKQVVNPALYDSWKYNKLEFQNATLLDIATTIEDIYGKEIIINDDSLKIRRFTGTVSRDNIKLLLSGLTQAFDFEVVHSEDKIYFKPNK